MHSKHQQATLPPNIDEVHSKFPTTMDRFHANFNIECNTFYTQCIWHTLYLIYGYLFMGLTIINIFISILYCICNGIDYTIVNRNSIGIEMEMEMDIDVEYIIIANFVNRNGIGI